MTWARCVICNYKLEQEEGWWTVWANQVVIDKKVFELSRSSWKLLPELLALLTHCSLDKISSPSLRWLAVPQMQPTKRYLKGSSRKSIINGVIIRLAFDSELFTRCCCLFIICLRRLQNEQSAVCWAEEFRVIVAARGYHSSQSRRFLGIDWEAFLCVWLPFARAINRAK